MQFRHPRPANEDEMLDWAVVVKAASSGFTLLLVAEAAAVVLGLIGAPAGLLVTSFAAAVYSYTGRRAAKGQDRAWQHGAAATVGAYLLTVPLRFITRAIVTPWFVLIGVAFAAGVGALAGRIQAGADATANGGAEDPDEPDGASEPS